MEDEKEEEEEEEEEKGEGEKSKMRRRRRRRIRTTHSIDVKSPALRRIVGKEDDGREILDTQPLGNPLFI
ncbi:hypothetical protein E2C01_077930 [Portunus trituberculatus]|uniref:Uncharacterized protein n=1 Tax=Portunus trituberculatus TaxID=210409 RepID=A0A5B7INJ3_PORTR|nr:hypothetical protein [Portunus trituberculatus]